MSTSSAEAFFHGLQEANDPFAVVDDLIQSGADENEWREFREAGSIDSKPFEPGANERLRQNEALEEYWSKNLIAFANSQGGLLIWGIKTEGHRAACASLAGILLDSR